MKFKSDIQAESKVGIGTLDPIYDLDVDGTARASGGFIDNTFTSDDTVRIVSPDNATYTVASGGETGAIKIQAPNAVLGGTTGTSTKVSFKVNISDGVVIQISGTFSRPGVGLVDVWTALSVTTISNASTDNNYTITGDKAGSGAIWIGSSTDSQPGLKGIWVTDCQVSGGNGGLFGGSPQSSLWDISINASVPTGFGTFLVNNTQVTNWKRNGQKLYYGSGSGNVGIGTSSPSELLHLSSTGPARLLIQADTDNVTESDNAQIILKQDGGAVVGNLGFKTNTNGLEMGNQYAGVDGILVFNTRNTERMRVSDLGKVGIGTTNPGAKLDVAGTGSFSDSVLFNKSVPTGAITPTRYRSHTGYSLTSDSNYQKMVCYGYNGDSANPIFQVATKGFTTDVTAAWDNDVSTRFTVLAGGKVGIGTTSPSDKLVVRNGTSSTDVKILAFNNAAGTEATLKFSTIASETNYEKAAIIARNAAGSFGRSDMHFALDSVADSGNVQFSDTKMTILNGGNVGIGTTSPKTMLHVVSGTSGATWTATAGTTGIFESSTSDRSFVTITGEDEAELWFGDFTTQAKGRVRYQTDTNVMSFWTNGTPKITIDATANVGNIGNVGIGTTSLTSISSSVATLSLGSLIANISGGIAFQANGTPKAYNYVANNYLINQTVAGIGQTFFGAGSERMRIHNTTGNVGINDTTPSYKLDVDGEGRFTGDLRCLSLIQTSQSDKKESISDIVKTTNKKIEFKEYVYKSDSGNRKRYGVLAEDIEIDYPELVHVDADGVKGVNYIDLLVKRVSELEKEIEDIAPRSMFLNWRGYHSSTNNGVLYDSGWSTNLTYPYATIIAPFKGSVTKVSITNNPYSSYQSGPTGDRATLEVVIDGRVVDGVNANYSKPSANEMITFNFSGNHEFSENDKVQLRFQSNGLWRYINTGIQLKETI